MEKSRSGLNFRKGTSNKVLWFKDTKEEPQGVDDQVECNVFDTEDNIFNSLSDIAPNKSQL